MRSSTTFMNVLVCFYSTVHSVNAWSGRNPNLNNNNSQVSRKSALQTLVQSGAASIAATTALVGQSSTVWAAEKQNSGVTIEVVKEGKGLKADVGELVAIRFAAYVDGRKIDDIFDTPEPYYTRLGSGGLLKGVESTLPNMKLGDRWKLTIPVRKHYM
jgi:FKBP-type peptidyl-prolyl cis-trans isomerase